MCHANCKTALIFFIFYLFAAGHISFTAYKQSEWIPYITKGIFISFQFVISRYGQLGKQEPQTSSTCYRPLTLSLSLSVELELVPVVSPLRRSLYLVERCLQCLLGEALNNS